MLLGRAIKDRQRRGGSGIAIVATKFAAYPWWVECSLNASIHDVPIFLVLL